MNNGNIWSIEMYMKISCYTVLPWNKRTADILTVTHAAVFNLSSDEVNNHQTSIHEQLHSDIS